MSLTANCELDSRVRSSAPQPTGIQRTATSAETTDRMMKRISSTAFLRWLEVDSASVMIRIGPNSPAAPAHARALPRSPRGLDRCAKIAVVAGTPEPPARKARASDRVEAKPPKEKAKPAAKASTKPAAKAAPDPAAKAAPDPAA